MKTTTGVSTSPPIIKRSNNESEWEFIFDVFKKHPQAFNIRPNKPIPQTLDDFKQEFVLDVCQASLCDEQVRLAVKSHSPLLSSIRKPQANHTHSSSLSINITSASTRNTTNNNNNIKSASVVSSPNNSIRFINHQAASSNRSSFNVTSIASAMVRKASASVSPPPPSSGKRKDSALLSVQDVQMQDSVRDVDPAQTSGGIDPNALLLFDKLLDKIVDGLILTNER